MPRRCCVPACKSNYDTTLKSGLSVSTFGFPKNAQQREAWLRAIPRKQWTPSSSSAVCIKHFSTTDVVSHQPYKTPDGKVEKLLLRCPKLRDGAIPKIFDNLPSDLSKKTIIPRTDSGSQRQAIITRNAEKIETILSEDFIQSCNDTVQDYKIKITERSEGMMGDEKLAVLSPAQKRARRRPLSVEEKQVVVNIYKTFTENNPTNSVSKITAMTAQASGLAISSVYKVMKEYRSGEMVSPKAKSGRPSIIKNLDEGAKSYIRQKVHGFFLQNELPSVDKLKAALDSGEDNDIVPPLGRTSLYKVIKELGMNLQEPPTTIKQELPEIDDFKEEITIHEEDPLRIEPTAAESLARISPKGVIFIKEEPLVYVKQEPSFNGDDVEELAEVNQTGEEQSFPNLDQDPVDLMFLEFAKKFKTFSGKRQLSLKSRFCQIMAEAEIEEINERQNAAVVFT